MSAQQTDAFILFNEGEDSVETIVHELERRDVSTYFWRRDIEAGASWDEVEAARLKEARTVVVFLGDKGWGPNHLKLAEQAHGLEKRPIPVLIGDPAEEAFSEVGGLFRRHRYVDLRQPNEAAMNLLVQAIRGREVWLADAPQLDGIIGTIRDGNESQRADVLEQIRLSKTLDRAALSERLRAEILDRFEPESETNFASAIRDPKRIASIRSWLLSCLIWTDVEDPNNRELILQHLKREDEPDRNVRFWTLAQLYARGASYVVDAAKKWLSPDDRGEILALAQAILFSQDHEVINQLRSKLFDADFEIVWEVLRALRIVPIPELAADVCAQLDRSIAGTPLAYDTLYALSNPPMARAAAPILAQKPGIRATVQRVLSEASTSDPNAARNFGTLLAALSEIEVDRALEAAIAEPASRVYAEQVRGFLRERRQAGGEDDVVVAGYASDTIDVSQDHIGISEDVYTLAAVMLAKEVKPPLAIGLFGDWGSGKSFFMQSIRKATERVSAEAAKSRESKFCSNIVSIEFNAWHYADTNLWASMVSYILEQLAAYVTPQPTPEEQQTSLVAQLGSAQAMVEEAEGEKRLTQELIESRAAELQKAHVAREQKEIRLRDLRASDFRSLIDGNPELRKKLDGALDNIGVPAVLDSASDLVRVISEANTLRGRIAALFVSVLQGKNRAVLITLLLFVLVVIPGAAYFLRTYVPDDFFVRVGAITAEVVALIVGLKNVLVKALGQVKASLAHIEEAKREVDKLLAKKRQELSEEEEELQKEIAALKAKEIESESRLSAATARVVDLEERIKAAKQGRSLAQFLAERTRSEDYRKYLGLISTIRQDFEALGKRLTGTAVEGDKFRRVDRIILYIDDLDRCPEEKVMEVLQAVHLLLAYPLFVVVVGVDPRWLLHSLRGTFKAFRARRKRGISSNDIWRTTPQNYLEKIFQIPFSLRPMGPKGYSELIGSLLLPKAGEAMPIMTQKQEVSPAHDAPQLAPPMSTPGAGGSPPFPDKKETTEPMPQQVPKPEVTKPDFLIHEESLTIKLWEAKFAERLFALIPTPRAAKRFSNVYRILKAPVQRERLRAFEGSAELPGEFQVPMLLLAILVGAPEEAADIFPKLWQMALAQRSPAGALRGLTTVFKPTDRLLRIQGKIRPIVSDPSFPYAPEFYADWIPRVSRFSFDVGRAVESTRYMPDVEASP